MNSPHLLTNLVFALGAAFIGAFLAARLGQSAILGYILAGIAIGPFTPGFVGDFATIEALAQIGIVFLLFTIGVQLSLRDLLRVSRVALIGGTLQVLLVIALGYLLGVGLGWPPTQALFFGAVLSNSSSTVLTKILEERGESESLHGRIALAWSSIQDFGTVILVVVLTALATGGSQLMADVLWAVARAILFLALLVPAGLFVAPRFLERVAALRSRELFVLAVAALALGTAYASSFFGLSLALGAFAAGVVIGESDLSNQIFGEILPLRDIFAGLFFVSVGMLINPGVLLSNPLLVLLALALIVLGKGVIVTSIALVNRYSLRTSLLTGVTLAQSAEFSFLMASLGLALGAVTQPVFSLMLAGAAISVILAPILHRAAVSALEWLGRYQQARLPEVALDVSGGPGSAPVGHAIICGYGRVGQVIGQILREHHIPIVVIDADVALVRRLRKEQVPALAGDATNPVLLDLAGLAQARALVIAIPDALAVRQIADFGRQANPTLDIVVRTHSSAEREYLCRRAVDEAVMGELELALEMTRHVLVRFGVSGEEAQSVVQALRVESRCAAGRRSSAP